MRGFNMKRQVLDEKYHEIRVEEAEPECGDDFCEDCGDCLACYGDEPCSFSDSGRHRWIVVENQLAAIDLMTEDRFSE